MTETEFLSHAADRRLLKAAVTWPAVGNLGACTIVGDVLPLWYEARRPDIESSRDGWRILLRSFQGWDSALVQLDWIALTEVTEVHVNPFSTITSVAPSVHPAVWHEALALLIHRQVRCRMVYVKSGEVEAETRDVVPSGVKGRMLYAHDNDRGALRSFKFDGILSIEPHPEARVPRWDGGAYVVDEAS